MTAFAPVGAFPTSASPPPLTAYIAGLGIAAASSIAAAPRSATATAGGTIAATATALAPGALVVLSSGRILSSGTALAIGSQITTVFGFATADLVGAGRARAIRLSFGRAVATSSAQAVGVGLVPSTTPPWRTITLFEIGSPTLVLTDAGATQVEVS